MAKKKTFRTVFIACEGKNSEPNYLGRLVETIDEARRLRVEVFPKPPVFAEQQEKETGRRSDPVGLVELAREKLADGAYDEAWAVFDCDGHAGLAEAFEKARAIVDGKTVRVAFSSIAFEHWVLLHFEQNDTAFDKSAELIEACFVQRNLFPDYGKNRKIDPYPFLKDKTGAAIENAAWLRHRQRAALSVANGKIYSVNPYTDIDELVKELLEIDLSVSWASFGEPISFAGHEVCFAKTRHGIRVEFSNRSLSSVVFNAQNLNGFFSLRPATALEISEAVLIAPGGTENIELRCPEDSAGDCVLVFKIGNQQLFVA